MSDVLLELQNKSLEIKHLMKRHNIRLEQYINNIKENEHENAIQDYDELKSINNEIDNAITQAQQLERQILSQDSNIDTTMFVGDDMNIVIQKLKADRTKIHELKDKLKNTRGITANASLETRSLRIKFLLICLLMVIVIVLTIRAFAFQPSIIDTIFLVTALLLGGFHFFNKQV